MAILSKQEIVDYLSRGELIRNPRVLNAGGFDVEPASYDLTAGILLWKDVKDGTGRGPINTLKYKEGGTLSEQPSVTLQPGQMAFVITLEEILMPNDLSGVVFSRNQLSRDGILALNAGHIDPGFHGPIVIRLINLRNTTYTVRLGSPIYSIVFNTLKYTDKNKLENHRHISMDDTLTKATESANAALSNALHDPNLSLDFLRREFGDPATYMKKDDFGTLFQSIKVEEFGAVLQAWTKRNAWKLVGIVATATIALFVFLATVIPALPAIGNFFKKMFSGE